MPSPKDHVAEIKDLMNRLEEAGYDVEPRDGCIDIIDTTMRDHGTGNPCIASLVRWADGTWRVLD